MDKKDACVAPTSRYPNGRTGLTAGYQAHRTAKEPACDACRKAQADAAREKYVPKDAPVGRPRVSEEHRREMRRLASERWRLANPERWKELQRESDAKRDPEATRATQRRTQARRRLLVDELKSCPCSDCGVQHPPYVMQFDHRDPATKEFSVGKLITLSWGRILKEVAKCDVVCANCHAERTWGSAYK